MFWDETIRWSTYISLLIRSITWVASERHATFLLQKSEHSWSYRKEPKNLVNNTQATTNAIITTKKSLWWSWMRPPNPTIATLKKTLPSTFKATISSRDQDQKTIFSTNCICSTLSEPKSRDTLWKRENTCAQVAAKGYMMPSSTNKLLEHQSFQKIIGTIMLAFSIKSFAQEGKELVDVWGAIVKCKHLHNTWQCTNEKKDHASNIRKRCYLGS
jgi:hypothetical protein